MAVYPIGVLAEAGNADVAEAFAAYVTSAEGRAILEEHGFLPPRREPAGPAAPARWSSPSLAAVAARVLRPPAGRAAGAGRLGQPLGRPHARPRRATRCGCRWSRSLSAAGAVGAARPAAGLGPGPHRGARAAATCAGWCCCRWCSRRWSAAWPCSRRSASGARSAGGCTTPSASSSPSPPLGRGPGRDVRGHAVLRDHRRGRAAQPGPSATSRWPPASAPSRARCSGGSRCRWWARRWRPGPCWRGPGRSASSAPPSPSPATSSAAPRRSRSPSTCELESDPRRGDRAEPRAAGRLVRSSWSSLRDGGWSGR